MAPPKWLVEYWENNKSWSKRFQRESWSINAELCGIDYDKTATLWNNETIKEFNDFMNKNSTIVNKKITLYRGTENMSPTMQQLCYPMKNCQYLSTSKSKAIAKEFMGRKNKGYLHIFYCQKGVRIYDMKDDYGSDKVKREKEVLILPNQKLTIFELKKNIVKWNVEN